MKAHIIHENDEWTLPLKTELKNLGVEFEDWHVEKANIDLGKNPPEGIFYNRMSASSHVRGHRYAPEYTATILTSLKNNKKSYNQKKQNKKKNKKKNKQKKKKNKKKNKKKQKKK